MAEIQNTKRQGTNQTWKEAYQDVEKTADSLRGLNEDFASFVADYNEFSDLREERFRDYLNSLGDVSKHWEEINSWIKKNSDTAVTYVGSLSNVRNIFQSIVSEIQGSRRQALDRINLVRNYAKIANESLLAQQQEGGLTDRVVSALNKKVKLADIYYNAQLEQLGLQFDKDGKLISNEIEIENLRRKELDGATKLRKEIERQEDLKARGIRIDQTKLKALRDQVSLREINANVLDKVTRDATKGLQDQIVEQERLYRIQRKGNAEAGINAVGSNRVSVASKLLTKAGLGEDAKELERDYGEWITRRVKAQQFLTEAIQNRKFKEDERDKLKKDYDTALKSKPAAAERLAAISQKERDLETALLKRNLAKEVLDRNDFDESTGRVRANSSGRFRKGSEATLNRVNAEYLKSTQTIKDLEKEILDLKKQQSEYTKGLASAAASYKDAQIEAEGAATAEQEALKNKEQVFGTVFDLNKKLVGSFKEGVLHLGKWGGPLGAALALAAAIFHHLLKFDEEAVKTKRVIGQWADASALANTRFVTGTEVLKTMRDLGEQFYINPVQVFSSEELGRIAQAQKLTGMTAQAAGNLAVQSKIIGKNANTYRDEIAKGANQANRLNHSAVNLSAVQNDVLNTSRAIALSYGKNTEGLARAAGAAAALGMNLQDVENVSKNLMNFESSIEAEMQAQLLTGMQLNLAKAREYALNNNLEGVASEIGRQGMDAAKFSHMNYIQQENMAKALGMSREQMSKMLIMQEINRGLTAKQVAAMTGMRRQDVEALSAQEKWQTMKQRFLESLVPLLEPILQLTTDILIPVTRFVLGPITWLAGLISRIGGLVRESNVFVRGLVGILAIGIPAALLRGIGLVGALKKGFSGIAKLGKSIGKNIASWATGIGKAEGAGGKVKTLFSGLGPARDYRGRTARQRLRDIRNLNKAKEINPAGAATTSKASASMGSAVSKLGKNIGKIATGAAAAVLLAGAVFILAKAAKEFEGVSWESMGKAGVAILGLTAAVLALGAIMSSGAGTVMVLAGAAAMVVMAGAVWILGNALKQVTAVPGNELQSIATGIRAIAGSVGELAAKLSGLSVRKLNTLGRAFKNLRGAGIQIQTPVRETGEVVSQVSRAPENTGESKEIKRETIEAAAQSITIKEAQVHASAQQISVEQKATDLSKIEQKIDRVIKAVVESRPDWNWLEFNRAYSTNS